MLAALLVYTDALLCYIAHALNGFGVWFLYEMINRKVFAIATVTVVNVLFFLHKQTVLIRTLPFVSRVSLLGSVCCSGINSNMCC